MDTRLDQLIAAFNRAQVHVMAILADKLKVDRPTSNVEWTGWNREIWDKAERNRLFVKPHGYGLVFNDSHVWIDFDFGANGEIDGFDAGRLFQFDRSNQLQSGFVSREEIQSAIEQATKSGEIHFSGFINYYRSQAQGI